jgi:uncharacterized protein (DUF362 family)
MKPYVVSLVRYEKPLESVRTAVEMAGGFSELPPRAKVFIKPNIPFWERSFERMIWGVVTTSRVIEDVVVLLKEKGIDNITIGEGPVTFRPRDWETVADAFSTLGFDKLVKRYGIKYLNLLEHPFEKVDLGDGLALEFSVDALASDYIINLPVLKTQPQTRVSLGAKNLKGLLSLPSRKTCHNIDSAIDLDYHIARLSAKLPPMFTLADGIYTLEYGPVYGKPRRSDILAASRDLLSLDMVGAKLLGYEPNQIRHLAYMAEETGRPLDLSDVEVAGEHIADLASFHKSGFGYSENGTIPKALERMGIKGLKIYQPDETICSHCAPLFLMVTTSIATGWKGEPFDDVEMLTGKRMQPQPGMKKTILMGDCMCKAHKNNPAIREMIPIKGCPPSSKMALKAMERAGIDHNPDLLSGLGPIMGLFSKQLEGRPEYDASFYRVQE